MPNYTQYAQRTFTYPASENRTSQLQWDFAFLEREEFEERWGQEKYTEMTKL
jgi:hypothetical protein